MDDGRDERSLRLTNDSEHPQCLAKARNGFFSKRQTRHDGARLRLYFSDRSLKSKTTL